MHVNANLRVEAAIKERKTTRRPHLQFSFRLLSIEHISPKTLLPSFSLLLPPAEMSASDAILPKDALVEI